MQEKSDINKNLAHRKTSNDVIFNKKIVYKGGKSVLNPTAQTTTLCNIGDLKVSGMRSLIGEYVMNSRLNDSFACLIEVLYIGGLRISEALHIGPGDISSNGTIKVKGLKGSSDRFVTISKHVGYLISCKLRYKYPFEVYSRYFVHRELIKLGMYMTFEGGSKRSTTHLFRHLKGLEVYSISGSEVDVSKVLGHKNVKNAKYYVRESK